MSDRILTKRALQQRLRAGRRLETSLPDQVRIAYGVAPPSLADLPSDDPRITDSHAAARASLVQHGHLSEEELETLPVDEAITLVLQRLRERMSDLQEQADTQSRQDRSTNPANKPPRTLRPG